MKRTAANCQIITGYDMYYPVHNTVIQIKNLRSFTLQDLTLEDAQELVLTLIQAIAEVTR